MFNLYNHTMSNVNRSKINQLLSATPLGVVLLSSWLTRQGYSTGLQQRYRESGWLESVGDGAMIRAGDTVGYEGALYALQSQAGLDVHPGARTAFTLIGRAHYIELAQKRAVLFGHQTKRLPQWLLKHDWGVMLDYHQSVFLPSDLGLVNVQVGAFSIKVSGAARAMMECLYLVPHEQPLFECYELMEGLTDLRPDLVQQLLEQCTSVKVKRLFMFLAEKADHGWVKYLDLKKVNFGKGKRAIVKNGSYVPKYQITVSKELMKDD